MLLKERLRLNLAIIVGWIEKLIIISSIGIGKKSVTEWILSHSFLIKGELLLMSPMSIGGNENIVQLLDTKKHRGANHEVFFSGGR